MRRWPSTLLAMVVSACTLFPGTVSIRRGAAGVVAISRKSKPTPSPSPPLSGADAIDRLSGMRPAPSPSPAVADPASGSASDVPPTPTSTASVASSGGGGGGGGGGGAAPTPDPLANFSVPPYSPTPRPLPSYTPPTPRPTTTATPSPMVGPIQDGVWQLTVTTSNGPEDIYYRLACQPDHTMLVNDGTLSQNYTDDDVPPGWSATSVYFGDTCDVDDFGVTWCVYYKFDTVSANTMAGTVWVVWTYQGTTGGIIFPATATWLYR